MHRSIFLLLLLRIAHASFAQQQKYPPFVVDQNAITATLKVKGDSTIAVKYAAVFKRHKLDAESPIDWDGFLEEIASMNENDLYTSKDVSFEANEEGVVLDARHIDDLEQMLKSLRLVVATPQKVDAFLSKCDASLQKTRK